MVTSQEICPNALPVIILGMDEEGGADTLSSPVAGRTSLTTSDEDVGPVALRGAKERGP